MSSSDKPSLPSAANYLTHNLTGKGETIQDVLSESQTGTIPVGWEVFWGFFMYDWLQETDCIHGRIVNKEENTNMSSSR